MSYPTEFPRDALATLLNYKHEAPEHLALSAYDLVGYALYLYFGETRRLVALNQLDPKELLELLDLANQIHQRFNELKGRRPLFIALRLAAEFGPKIVEKFT